MKKLALLLAFLLVLTLPATVLARQLQIPDSYTFTTEMTLNLDVSSPDLDLGSEFEAAMAFLRNVTLSAQGTMVMDTETNLTSHLHMEVSVRAGIFYIPFTLWMDMDFSQPDEPVYIIIVELPDVLQALIAAQDPELAVQFWVLDYGPFYAELPGMAEFMGTSAAMGAEFTEAILDMLPEAEALGDNQYRIAMSDSQLTEFIIDVVEFTMDVIMDRDLMGLLLEAAVAAEGQELDADELEEMLDEVISEVATVVQPELERIYTLLRNVTLLAEDWVTYYQMDENGFTVREDSQLKIVFDLVEWANAAITVFPELFRFVGIDDVPNVVVTLDLEYAMVYEDINAAERVPLPTITPENSIDLVALLGL
jgi:hypothetical protein